ncbi:DUF2635 domain-containing protein [Vibrio jasicida]|uniref:DUF2635 domain-containing protein n=1 Tax=Vibrio jasicida TaxID=766224 RepID=UPI00148CD632|nr:DUF2635 domain-containing protein [Vibrio jasicida]NOJ18296.1 DUF2635 domain-containing protein [Vibrio jasicida]
MSKKSVFLIQSKPKVPVRKPEGGHLSVEGEDVEKTSYWIRRINDGDVLVDAKARQHKKKLAAAAKKAKADSETKGE